MAILLAMARNTENLTLNTSSRCEQSELAKQDIFFALSVPALGKVILIEM